MGLIIFIAPQLLVTKILYGTWVTDPQGDGGMHWFSPNFRIILFDGIKGLFTVNPVLLPAVAGLPFLWKKNRRLTWGMLLLIVSQTYINAVRRDWAGVGFGMRRFLNLTPGFVLGLMVIFMVLRLHERKKLRIAAWFTAALMTFWNLLLMGQYYLSSLGAPWIELSMEEMVSRQFSLSPGLLWELIESGLLIRGLQGDVASLGMALLASAFIVVAFFAYNEFAVKLNKLFLSRSGALLAVFLFIPVFLAGWLTATTMATQEFKAVNMLPGQRFGTLRPLQLNRESGYHGYAGGIVMGPGKQWKVQSAKAEYNRDKFLELGKMTYVPEVPFSRSDTVSLSFNEPVETKALHLISYITPEGQLSEGSPVGEISLVTTGGALIRLPVLHGVHTMVSKERQMVTEGQKPEEYCLLERDWPAIIPVEDGKMETRYVYRLTSSRRVVAMKIRFFQQPVEWKIRGLCFE